MDENKAVYWTYKAINRNLAVMRLNIGDTFRLIPNPWEFTKAYIIADAESKWDQYLPLTIGNSIETESPQGRDLELWRIWLTGGQFRTNPSLFRQLVEPLDLSKPFDEKLAREISEKFKPKSKEKITIDAAEIEQGE